ncbi:Rieske (2Fe-2S) domain-containing protein [Sinomonas atrocyanea]|uniref:Rieske (2Fe-2S) domain-containing protein n=1 Tax=Sinomonas atrocyanea TaxID=37927 RepID=A0A127A4Q6_9MICC|nr:aromatic ring-hydroxylating dioxygenase subunit alpha [Sinomonas atrocyanea]AMM34450.1 Rieske (2Fe-2S) domain-containing protein [Sinomonas atrocyanea]GEB65826.1 (2Fe-2S)-binding protein [Sinomonas atrocyanea]GGG61151.1 (2Fe-2S)-binding protein [Sinomonas atrocyanea]
MRSPIPLEEFDASCGDIDDVVSLPPTAFTSQEFYDFELDAVFGHEWLCIGRATDIPKKGDYFTVDALGEQLLVVRQADGSVRVQSNVCRHRAMRIATGSGNARRFKCDYHSWVYGLDGELQSAPDLNENPCFVKASVKLPQVRSEIWENFVFITFDPDIAPVSSRLSNLSAYLANWGLSELKSASPQSFFPVNCNWKVFGDECYHCAHLHSKSWCPMYDTASERIDYDCQSNEPEKGIIAYDLVSLEKDLSPTRTGKNLQPVLPGLTEDQRRRLVYVTVAPNLLLIAMPDKVKYFMWLPTSPTTSVFAATWLYPDSTLQKPGFTEEWEMEVADLKEVMVEDLYAWESVQTGMSSRTAPRGRYAPSEIVLVRLNEWLISKYREADSKAREEAGMALTSVQP